MRTPQRNFVVEYKTNRRQTKAMPTSIWGNLNLRAMAEAVESDGVLPLIERDDAFPDRVGSDRCDREVEAILTPVETSGHDVLAEVQPLQGEFSSEIPHSPVRVVTDCQDDSSVKQTATQRRSLKSRPLIMPVVESRKIKTQTRPVAQGHRDLIFAHTGSDEELARLTQENRNLKRLLSDKLRIENENLRWLLSRFGKG